MRTVITTVGTSLLTNRSDDRPWNGWKFRDPPPDKIAVSRWLKNADLTKASAEIHTWHKLQIFEKPESHRIVLIHSQTDDGKFCAECLHNFVTEKRINASVREVPGLNYKGAVSFNRGLSRLIRTIAEEIRAARNKGEAIIAATGGFKAEIAIANITGTLLGAPVYYIYEQFEELIKIEPIPIELSPKWLKEGAGRSFLAQMKDKDCMLKREIDSYLKNDTRLESLIEEADADGDTLVCLNPLGTIAAEIISSPAVQWPEITRIEPKKKISLQNISHHRPKNYVNVVDKIARVQYVTSIRYDANAGKSKGVQPAPENSSDLFYTICGKDQSGSDAFLPLRISTTAENEEQRKMVINLLEKELGL